MSECVSHRVTVQFFAVTSLAGLLLTIASASGQTSAVAPRYALSEGATFSAVEVSIPRPGEAGAFRIAGTLNIPKAEAYGKGPYPAVFFVSGSGSQDRHGFQGRLDIGTWELLDAVADAGFCVLRVDDRGLGGTPIGPEGTNAADVGFQDLVGDARSAVRWLRAHQAVDPKRVFLIGHSEGGLTAQILANEPEMAIAGLVSMAGMGRNLWNVTYDQVANAQDAAGVKSVVKEFTLRVQLTIMQAVKDGVDPDFSIVPKLVWARIQPIRKWWHQHFLLNVDAIQRAIRCPTLVVQGAADFQVSPEKDARHLAGVLAAGPSTDVTLRIFDDLDHLFKPCGGKPSSLALYMTKRSIDARFKAFVVRWLIERAR